MERLGLFDAEDLPFLPGGVISGREVVNMVKTRATGPFNDISAICLKRPGPLFDANTAKSRVRAGSLARPWQRRGEERGWEKGQGRK